MLTDLRYAVNQLRAARQALLYDEKTGAFDAMRRATDALERCVEAAPAMEAAYDAALEAQEEAEAESRRQACIGANLPAGFVDRL